MLWPLQHILPLCLCVDFWTDIHTYICTAKSFEVKVIFSAKYTIVAFFDMYDAIMTSFSDCLYADMGSFRSKRQRLPRQTGNLEFIQKDPIHIQLDI